MNFLVDRHQTRPELTGIARGGLAIAMVIVLLELLVLWQFMQPASLLFSDPHTTPRPDDERIGILKRF